MTASHCLPGCPRGIRAAAERLPFAPTPDSAGSDRTRPRWRGSTVASHDPLLYREPAAAIRNRYRYDGTEGLSGFIGRTCLRTRRQFRDIAPPAPARSVLPWKGLPDGERRAY